MSDTNVGMGMVPHRKNCRCLECENERLLRENADLIDDNSRLIIDFDTEINLKDQHIARLESMLDRLAEGDFPDYGIGHDPAKWQSDEIRLSREYAASHRSEDDDRS